MTELPITPLARPVSTRLRSALIIPTLPQILNELVQNSLDARCTRVDCYLDLTSGNECIRAEDDGHGLDLAGLKRVGESNASSKERTDASLTPLAGYGFRGEALSSIAALAQLEIATKTVASRHTYTKVFRTAKVVAMGRSNRAIIGPQGTTVSVKDIYHKVNHAIPVRQAALAATPTSTTMAGCKRVIESLALVHPGVKFIMWEERYAGPSTMNEPKKILSIGPGRASIDIYKAIYGGALVEKVQSIRVSDGTKRLDGFISLQGSLSRSNQHLYINKFAIERGELHAAISKRFANSRFSYMAQDDVESTADHQDRRRSPRRLERHPIYVLNITIPPEEVDASYAPRKNIFGYKDETSVQAFVLAVVDEFLKRHGFASDKHQPNTVAPSSASPSRSSKSVNIKPTRPSTPIGGNQLLTQHFSQSVDRSMPPPPRTSRKESLLKEAPRTPGTEVRNRDGRHGRQGTKRKRETWLDDLRANTNTGVLPITPDQLLSFLSTPIPFSSATSCRHRCSRHPDSPHISTTDIRFTADSLTSATVIGQVDKKFIACLIENDDTSAERSLVLIDQHAADERVAVEEILRELCHGFANNSVRQTALDNTHIILTRYEADRLSKPAVLDLFSRWGITFVPPPSTNTATAIATYVQVAVTSIPALLAYRLARKETSELTRLIRHYLTVLPDILPQIRAATSIDQQDWQLVQRWMPKEMLELANSKACRNAIMFEDTLDHDQCCRLVARLATTRSPWICAHGRPSLVPLGTVPIARCDAEGSSGTRKRQIDWTTLARSGLY